MQRLLLVFFVCLFFLAEDIQAQTSDASANSDTSFHPNIKPTLKISRRIGEIIIDGDLNDVGWQNAETADNFCQSFPVFEVKPQVATYAKVTYDDKYLYFAMIAEDSTPSNIRVSSCARDNISSEDFMGIILDTYGDGTRAFEIYSNAYGIQEDLFWTSSNEDGSYDLIYETEAKITSTGWQVEFKIPFKSLRFPDIPVKNFHCSFWRSYPREVVHKYSWAAMNFYIPCPFCQFGSLSGIENIHSSASLELLPALVASQSAAANPLGSPMKNDKIEVSPSLGLRYALGTATGLELALNPDFSQVESDAAQISANTTFALFYPERRPFFQDGADLFSTNFQAIYTRSINSPLVAAKAIHRDESTSFAYIGAYDEHSPVIIPLEERSVVQSDVGKSISNIVRATHSFGNNTRFGGLLTNRSYNGDGMNTVTGLDATIGLFENVELMTQGLFSYTQEPKILKNGDTDRFDNRSHSVEYNGEHFSGFGSYLSLQRHTTGLDVEIYLNTLSPAFRAGNGFIFNNDDYSFGSWTGYKFPLSSPLWFTEFDMSVFGEFHRNFEGQTKLVSIKPELDFSFVGQTNAHIFYRHTFERFHNVAFANINYVNAWMNSRPLSWLGFGGSVRYGTNIARFLDTPVLGRQLDWECNAQIKPFGGLLIELGYYFSRLDSINDDGSYYSGAIYRSVSSYQFSRQISARVIVQYDEFSNALEVDPLFTYQINPFTNFYLGSSHNYNALDANSPLQPSQRQFFAKVQYLFQS